MSSKITEKKIIRITLNVVDDFFILSGICLNGVSLVIGFILGHTLASIFLSICELLLIAMYLLKVI